MLKFFTCITQNLVFMYYLTSIIFLLFGYKNLHAYFYVSTFAYDMTMMSIYWAANFYDQTMITSIEDLKYMPIWFNHFAHTYGLPALLLDAYLCIPKCVSFKKSMMVSFPLGMAYNIYVETGILLWNTSPYPEILKYGFPLRYISYVSVWLNL
uniref:Uncharacterized protein n=1 Tax=Trichobilharzia regenti TaxID=157069 RepID=A0AA85IYI0_TRIRE